jgi:hypothetical protein
MTAISTSMGKCRLMFLSCLVLFCSAPTFGFCFEPHPTVACDFLNSDAVFSGKVLSRETVNGGDAFEYRVSVVRLFRGPHDKVIDIYTGNDSGGYPLDVGSEYLFFTYKYKDQLWISNCDDSVPVSEAKELIGEIQGIAVPQDAIIEGRIILNYVPSNKGVAGINVLIRGEGRTYRLTTDQQGWFHLHVAPGAYSVEAESTPADKIVAYDLNYGGNPKKFVAKASRCSGFEFVANPVYKY